MLFTAKAMMSAMSWAVFSAKSGTWIFDVSAIPCALIASTSPARTVKEATPKPPPVVPCVPRAPIRPLRLLGESTVVSAAAVKVPSASIAASTVAAVVAPGSMPIVKVRKRLSKMAVAASPGVPLSSNTTSTLFKLVPEALAVTVKSLFAPMSVIVSEAKAGAKPEFIAMKKLIRSPSIKASAR